MNFHSYDWIMNKMWEHYNDALTQYPEERIIGVFYQGSGNYGLDYEGSDVDTKCVVIPTIQQLVNEEKTSKTYVRSNDEHIDFKDIRVMLETFRKSNLNFLEILYTKYYIINPIYAEEWNKLVKARDSIVKMNLPSLIKSMKGIASEKYHALEHRYPSRMHVIEKWGYDCYTDDTMFLTRDGWKSYYEIEDNEEIGTLNPQTKELEFQNFYQRFCNQYNGEIYDVETFNSHFSVTPNHKIYTSPIKNINKNGHQYIEHLSDWKLEPIQDVMNTKKHRHLATIYNNNNDLEEYEGVKITDDLLKLIGAFVSEGTISFRDNQPKSIQISQTDLNVEHNLNFIKMMDSIHDIKINKFSYPSRNNKNYHEIIWTTADSILREKLYQWCHHKSENKRLPKFIFQLSKRQANIMLDSLCLGDGTEHTSRRVYYTISKLLAEDVQILSTMAEHYAVVMGGESGFKNKCNFTNKDLYTYQVAIKKEDYLPNWCYFKLGKNVHIKEYNGNIVCFSVPNSILITQHKGKIAIQGNCKQLHHLFRIKEFMNRWVQGESFERCLISVEPEWLVDVKKGKYNLEDARRYGKGSMDFIQEMYEGYLKTCDNAIDETIYKLFEEVTYNIIKIGVEKELEYNA